MIFERYEIPCVFKFNTCDCERRRSEANLDQISTETFWRLEIVHCARDTRYEGTRGLRVRAFYVL